MLISERSQALPSQPLLAHALASVATPIFIADEKGKIIWANNALSKLSGYSLHELVGHKPSILQSGKHSPAFYSELWQTILSGNVWQGEVIDQRKDGSLYTADETITPILGEQIAPTHFVCVQHDITWLKRESDRVHHLACHDTLAGLPNRATFFAALQQAIDYHKRERKMFAMLFLDLDNFKPINDMRGHQKGDQLLAAVAERLRLAVRRVDTIARFGGDEFVALIGELADMRIAQMLAHNLVENLSRPYMLHGHKFDISVSIGISIYPADGEEPEILLMNADKAMYRAKRRGGNSCQFYDAASSRL